MEENVFEKLKEVVSKLSSLLEDPEYGLFTWNQFVAERLEEIRKITFLLMGHRKAYFVGIHRYCFKAGEPAEILRVVIHQRDEKGSKPTPCFHVRYKGGKEDYKAICDTDNYQIISESDIKSGNIPKVIN